jgi:phospholipid/cholesterol/gamma-HCH transport system substrate-binding protein
MNDQAIRFRLGIFVLAVFIVLAVLIVLFGGFPNYFKKVDAYTILFDSAEGVSAGTPVRKSGVKVGEVRSVKLDNDSGKVLVGIQVDEGFIIRKSDRATLTAGLLTGDTSIAILPPEDPAKADLTRVEPGGVIIGSSGSDTMAFLKKTGELVKPAEETLLEMRTAFKSINKMTPLMEESLKEFRDVAKATRELMPELRKTNADIDDLARATREAVPELRKTNDEIRELAKATRSSIPTLKTTAEEVQLFARTWTKVGERMDVLLQTNEEKITKIVSRAEETLRRFNDLLSDENQRNLRDILKNAKSGSDRLEGIAKGTEDLIRDSQIAVKKLNESLLKADSVLDNIDKASKPFATRSEPILKNLEESTDKLNRILGDMRETIGVLGRSDGTLQKLISDPSLYQNLNDTAIMVQKILPRVDRILYDVEIFADKIARHPEALGVGGAIRPGTGLKESSTIAPWRNPFGH